MPPQKKPTHHPLSPFPPLFNSVHQHFLLQPVSVTLHFLSGLNQSDSPQSARFWVSLKRQRASKSITAFLIFIDPKTRTPPPHSLPTRPHISLRGINYSKEGDCAEVWKWCCLADCTCNSFNKVFKNVQPSAPQSVPERKKDTKKVNSSTKKTNLTQSFIKK